jgi:UDP-glucose 4-epimerase
MPITVWGDGSISRDYFFIGDLVAALIAAAIKPLDFDRIFNIGGSQEITLNSLLEHVEATVKRKATVEYMPKRKFDAPRIFLDSSLAKRVMGWEVKVPLDQGLARTWEWMSVAIGD